MSKTVTVADPEQPASLVHSVRRYTVRILIALALIYALFAGLRTIGIGDLGWQLATGRWIVQNHSIPSTDVLSHTARGREWIYPALSQVLLFCVFSLGGYSLLSWFGTAACVGTVAILLRRSTVVTALLAVIAAPMIASRSMARADMFTELLFATFVSILWHFHRTGRGPLWALPALMCLWVNLHLGFIAGLGMCAAYVGLELGEAVRGSTSLRPALGRLRRAVPWLLATALVTMLNPWGPRIFVAMTRQNSILRIHSRWISEWSPVRISPSTLADFFLWRDPRSGLLWLMAAALVAVLIAIYQRRIVAAGVLGASIYFLIHAIRFQAVFASVVVIIGGSIIADAVVEIAWKRFSDGAIKGAAVALLLIVSCFVGVRVSDLVTDRYYMRTPGTVSTFGPGESSLFPDQAAAFVKREQLPQNLFNNYILGGYLTWKLGPMYADYIDGRAIPFGPELFLNSVKLQGESPDSFDWQQEAEDHNINTVFVSLDYVLDQAAVRSLSKFCESENWRPVFLDAYGAVFLRRSPDTEGLINRYQLDCNTVPFGSLPSKGGSRGRAEQFRYFLNTASVLLALGRNAEALDAAQRAEQIFSENAYLHYVKGMALFNTDRPAEGEQQLLTSLQLNSEESTALALSRHYAQQGRYADEEKILHQAAERSAHPNWLYFYLGKSQLALGMTSEALRSFDKAERESLYIFEAYALGENFRRQISIARQEANTHPSGTSIVF